MIKDKILKGNRIIAEFLVPNWELLKSDEYNGGIDGKDLYIAACLCSEDYSFFAFHKSWNSLMPVINKIEDISRDFSNYPPFLSWIRNNETIFDLKLTESTIELAWEETLKFINWYNENEK